MHRGYVQTTRTHGSPRTPQGSSSRSSRACAPTGLWALPICYEQTNALAECNNFDPAPKCLLCGRHALMRVKAMARWLQRLLRLTRAWALRAEIAAEKQIQSRPDNYRAATTTTTSLHLPLPPTGWKDTSLHLEYRFLASTACCTKATRRVRETLQETRIFTGAEAARINAKSKGTGSR